MGKKKSGKKKKKGNVDWECPNPKDPYTLWGLVELLETRPDFAGFFFDKLRDALDNKQSAIDCVESYLDPQPDELMELGVPLSGVGSHRKCTDSGLLVAVVAKQSAQLRRR